MNFTNIFSGMTLSNDEKPPVKKDFNYFIEEKRSKKDLLDYFKRIAKRLDIDPDDIKPEEEDDDE